MSISLVLVISEIAEVARRLAGLEHSILSFPITDHCSPTPLFVLFLAALLRGGKVKGDTENWLRLTRGAA
jgi:hypothetical protein